MYKMENLVDLKKLDESAARDLIRYGTVIVDDIDESKNIRERIIVLDGRNYYHKMQDGEIVECYEIFEYSRHTSANKENDTIAYAYMPDGKHIRTIQAYPARNWLSIDCMQLKTEEIKPGMRAEYGANVVKYIAEDLLEINGKLVKIESNSDYIYKILKTKIKAKDGAAGLFAFLDQIAEEKKLKRFALFDGSWEMIVGRSR